MEGEQSDISMIDDVYNYLKEGVYRKGATSSRKRVIRRKAAKFEIKDGEIYYKQTTKTKVR